MNWTVPMTDVLLGAAAAEVVATAEGVMTDTAAAESDGATADEEAASATSEDEAAAAWRWKTLGAAATSGRRRSVVSMLTSVL